MALLSGHGTTLGFSVTTAFSPGYTSIGGYSLTRESLDTTTLDTTGARTKIGGDLFDVGDFTSRYLLDVELQGVGEAEEIDVLLFDSGSVAASETVTLTLPVAGSTVAGSAHVTGFELEELTTGAIIAAAITVMWDDVPTWTDAT